MYTFAIYAGGVITGFVVGALLGGMPRRPDLCVRRCREQECAGPLPYCGVLYDERGRPEILALLCRHKAADMQRRLEREPPEVRRQWKVIAETFDAAESNGRSPTTDARSERSR